MKACLVAVDRRLQAVQPLGFHLLGNLVRQFGRRRSRPGRIFEREGAGVADLVDQRERRSKIVLALAGEADDEIGGERHVRPRGAHARDGVEIVGARVAAVHGGEDAVGAGLHRKVQIGHQARQVAMRRDQALLHVAGMAGGVAQPRDARHFGDAREQLPERPGPAVGSFAVIGVDVLADQRDLAHAGLGEPLDLGDDLHDRPRRFGAARIGHDAERAELVAAFLHGDEGRYAARARRLAARRRELVELVLDRKLGVDHGALAAFALRARAQRRGKAVIALRPDHEIDRRRAADDLLALGLRDAARDCDRHAAACARRRLLEHADAAELGIDLLGRLLADVAGVEDDEIGVLDAARSRRSPRARACPPYDGNRRRSSGSRRT